jgi:hypothetical protein
VAVVKKMEEMMMRVTIEREHQAASVADRQSACQRASRTFVPGLAADGSLLVDALLANDVPSDPIPLIDMT